MSTTNVEKINFYIASLFSEIEDTKNKALKISKNLGWKCNARWVFGGEDGLSRSDIASLDLEDVSNCDVFVIISHKRGEPKPGGGRWVEFGYALALNKKCYVVGPYENVFCHDKRVKVYPSVDCLISDMEIH